MMCVVYKDKLAIIAAECSLHQLHAEMGAVSTRHKIILSRRRIIHRGA